MQMEDLMQPNMNRASKASKVPVQYDLQADIEELRKLLSERHADPRKQRFGDLYDTIQALIAAGVSHAAIIRKLKSMDLSISPVTFKNWIAEMRGEREGQVASKRSEEQSSQMQEAMRRASARGVDGRAGQ
ncbi:hypothetical protein AB4Y45_21205 [Paraburkholderia sp. EG287A]|uniref:hypothetical protein n=1 Tax=Paraburkholderia sp. EG287A TaxID=3237012 RepID=UPI0034D35999